MKIVVTAGTGEGPTAVAAFDAALRSAGVENYNLISLSSIIPPGSTIERAIYMTPSHEYGHRLYVVMARCDEQHLGREAWELCGDSRSVVQEMLEATLTAMMRSRGCAYGPVDSEIAGIACRGRPVCAVVIAVYQSEGWRS
jgi:arginine decarboxylase